MAGILTNLAMNPAREFSRVYRSESLPIQIFASQPCYYQKSSARHLHRTKMAAGMDRPLQLHLGKRSVPLKCSFVNEAKFVGWLFRRPRPSPHHNIRQPVNKLKSTHHLAVAFPPRDLLKDDGHETGMSRPLPQPARTRCRGVSSTVSCRELSKNAAIPLMPFCFSLSLA